jgi:hypothetical protein
MSAGVCRTLQKRPGYTRGFQRNTDESRPRRTRHLSSQSSRVECRQADISDFRRRRLDKTGKINCVRLRSCGRLSPGGRHNFLSDNWFTWRVFAVFSASFSRSWTRWAVISSTSFSSMAVSSSRASPWVRRSSSSLAWIAAVSRCSVAGYQ